MKRAPLVAVTAAVTAPALTGCSDSVTSADASTPVSPTSETYPIGTAQTTTRITLDGIRKGFKKAFKDTSIQVKYDERNTQGDQTTVVSTTPEFASPDLSLVFAITIPSAQVATQLITKALILFITVTDPVPAQFIGSLETPGSNTTSTTDMNSVVGQISLVKEFAPKAETLDIIYSSGETNSEVQVELAEEVAAKGGFQTVEPAVVSSAKIQQTTQDLASEIDTIYIPTGSTVVSTLASIVQTVEGVKVPLIAEETNSVAQGALATHGIDYPRLGHQTGEMAVRILKEGAEPVNLPVEAQKDYELTINATTLKALGLELPASLKGRTVTIGWLENLSNSSLRARDGYGSSLR